MKQTVQQSLSEDLNIIGAVKLSGDKSTWSWKLTVPTELRMNKRYSQVNI